MTVTEVENARTVPCPICKMPARSPCVDEITGAEVRGVHQARIYRQHVVATAVAENLAVELRAEVERLAAELAAMTELHDQKHRDWQAADNARQGLLVDRGNLRADLQLYEPARHGNAVYWLHACGHIEWFTAEWRPEDGGCDACESGSDIPADWQPLYIRRGGEPS